MKGSAYLLLLTVSYAPICLAGLGSERGALESEKSALRVESEVQVTEAQNYTMLTMQTSTGTIHQYANRNGQIFAVTWRGTHPPDMSVLLGNHFADYQIARQYQVKLPGRTPLFVKTSKITVRHSGHMRDLRGLAYESGIVPPGLNPETLP